MKTELMDYIVVGLLLAGISLLALLTAAVFSILTVTLLDDYHIVSDALVFLLAFGLYAAAVCRVILKIRPFLPGTYSMDDPFFFYWKLYTVVYEFGKGALLPFTTLFARPLLASLFGARIGKQVAIGGRFGDLPLIEVADGAVIGADADIVAHAITSGSIILKKVKIGKGATVGLHAVVMPGVEVGENSVIMAGSVVSIDTKIPANELWGGIPARKIKHLEPTDLRA